MSFLHPISSITILISLLFIVSISGNKKNDLKYIPQHQPLTFIGHHVPQLPTCPPGLTYSPKHYQCLPKYVAAHVPTITEIEIEPIVTASHSNPYSVPAQVPAIAEIEIEPIVTASHPNPYSEPAAVAVPIAAAISPEIQTIAEIEIEPLAGHDNPMNSLAELINLALIKFDRMEMKLDVALSGVNALSQVMVHVLPQLAQTCKEQDDNVAAIFPFFGEMNSNLETAASFAPLQTILDQKMFDAFNAEDSELSFSSKIDSQNDEQQSEPIDNQQTKKPINTDQKQQQSVQTSMNGTSTNETKKNLKEKKVSINQSEQLRKEENESRQRLMEKIRKQTSSNIETFQSINNGQQSKQTLKNMNKN